MRPYKRLTISEMSVQEDQEAVVALYYRNESLALSNIVKKIMKELKMSKNEILLILDQSGVLG